MNLIKHMVTGIDNETTDPARVAFLVTFLTFISLAIYAVVGKGQTWDPLAFGSGAGAVLALGGVGIAAKAKTEPGQ